MSQTSKKDPSYTLRRGDAGGARLQVLGDAMWPSTQKFLEKAGLAKGHRCLDMGCGIGVVTRRIAGITGHCLGVDVDPDFTAQARRKQEQDPIEGLQFQVGDLQSFDPSQELFDFVYSRYLLSHLGEPGKTLNRLTEFLKPGGTLLIEDIDFPHHFHHPPNPAFQRYLELYQAVVARNGGNACIGRELLPLAQSIGLVEIEVNLVVSVHHDGASKEVTELTFAHISDALLQTGLSTEEEVTKLSLELRSYREDPSTQMSIAPTFQLSASFLGPG